LPNQGRHDGTCKTKDIQTQTSGLHQGSSVADDFGRLMRWSCVQADKFHKTGRQLRSKMWWQNMKMKILVVLVILILIFVIFLIVCFSGGNCIKK